MKATNLKLCGVTTISAETVSISDEYAICQPKQHTRMPVFAMTVEPKSDRRYVRREASLL